MQDLFWCCGSWCSLCVQASSGRPPQCPCWPTPPSLPPCSRCCFRTRPRPSRYKHLFCLFPWLMPLYHPACFWFILFYSHTHTSPPLLSALSLLTISKPFWEIISFGLRCCTIKKTLSCLVWVIFVLWLSECDVVTFLWFGDLKKKRNKKTPQCQGR